MVYRVIDAGMVSLPDVLDGKVSLADIVEASHYLDMKSDIEWAKYGKSMEGRRKAWLGQCVSL